MTTLNDFLKVDGTHYPLAEYFNFFYSASLRAELTNTEAISATKELSDNDVLYQVITASGADRTVELAPEASTNHPTLVYNTSTSNNIPVKDDSGMITFITLGPDGWAFFVPVNGEGWKLIAFASVVSISPTTANITASPNTHYQANVSGLTANRNFIIPAPSKIGDEIEINISTGDDAFAFLIIGDTSITINSGSAATEWSRLFITGEKVRLRATSATNWQVIRDGRIPCLGTLERTGSHANTTHSAASEVTLDWNSAAENRGDICDTTNDRFNIRRAGTYQVSGAIRPANNVTDQKYADLSFYKTSTKFGYGILRAPATGRALFVAMPTRRVVCTASDTLILKFSFEEANIGVARTDESGVEGQTFFSVKEVF